MEHSLLDHQRLTSAWTFGHSPDHSRERAVFIIETLARVGDRDAVEILKRFVGDPNLGEKAIGAIKATKGRES